MQPLPDPGKETHNMTLNETSDSRTISAEPLNIITQQAVGYDYCLVIGSHWLQNGFLFFVRLSDKNERGAAAFIQFVWTHFLFEWNFGYIQVPNNDVQTNTQRLNLKHFLERYSKWEVLLVSSGWIHIKELWNKMHDNVCYLISPPWYAERLYCFNCVGICQRDIILCRSARILVILFWCTWNVLRSDARKFQPPALTGTQHYLKLRRTGLVERVLHISCQLSFLSPTRFSYTSAKLPPARHKLPKLRWKHKWCFHDS